MSLRHCLLPCASVRKARSRAEFRTLISKGAGSSFALLTRADVATGDRFKRAIVPERNANLRGERQPGKTVGSSFFFSVSGGRGESDEADSS